MKVLHISGAKGWGGNEQQLMYIAPAFEHLEIQNFIYGLTGSELEQKSKEIAVTFIPALKSKLVNRKNFSHFKSVVEEIQPDVIHLHTSDSLTFFVLVDMLYGLKVKSVFSKKGMGVSSSILSRLKYNYKGLDKIICVSEKVKSDFSKTLTVKNSEKIEVIHDCISLDIKKMPAPFSIREKFGIDSNVNLIGNIANHSSAKDLPTLISAIDILVNQLKFRSFKLIQLGEFSKRTPGYQALVSQKKLDEYIVFCNKIENAFALNPQFDLFVMSSQREGGPTSVLEALYYGIPVVSTNVGVVREVVHDTINGYVVDAKDSLALAQKIQLILETPGFAEKAQDYSITKITSEFNALHIATMTYDCYQRLVQS
jgi:glycosyltransferase involved in cell wall biosynthesis